MLQIKIKQINKFQKLFSKTQELIAPKSNASDQSQADSLLDNSRDTTEEAAGVRSTLADLDLSADLSLINLDEAGELDEFDMMIQSAGPFQHPRSSQNYGHGANAFRQSYHHQVSISINLWSL